MRSEALARWLGTMGVAFGLLVGFGLLAAAEARAFPPQPLGEVATVSGTVESADTPLASYGVTLYQAGRTDGQPFGLHRDGSPLPRARPIGQTTTDAAGQFSIDYRLPSDQDAVLYLVARRGPVALATVLGSLALPALPNEPDPIVILPLNGGSTSLPTDVVINERTTVATAFAYAQFLQGTDISGNRVGVRNAAGIVGDLVDVTTGEIAPVLAQSPNGSDTSTLATFNSLANMIAACVATASDCTALFQAASGPSDFPPRQTLQAMDNIARNPWRNIARLFDIATASSAYQPALGAAPDAWTIALKFKADGRLNGPGNFAFDAEGTSWATNNYTPPSDDPTVDVCPGRLLFRFKPSGQLYPGAPYTGGGLSGQGYGITFDLEGNNWSVNFGFSSPECAKLPPPLGPTNDSVSQFAPDGTALSPDDGFTEGGVSWPQGAVTDRRGNIWIANCGNNSVTIYPEADPQQARNLGQSELGIEKPFDIKIDLQGRAWVTGNGNGVVGVIGPKGLVRLFDDGAFDRPLGLAADSRGNMWVTSSTVIDVPCPDGGFATGAEIGGWITLITANGKIAKGAPFTGGGIVVPWGIAVDGYDNVWVANFGSGQDVGGSTLSRVSQFCGANPSNCPPGLKTGDPISPPTGYTNNGMLRLTAVQVDPSGNLWVTNNWKIDIHPNNPGGDSIMIFVGIAGPIKTPLIGPPQPAERRGFPGRSGLGVGSSGLH